MNDLATPLQLELDTDPKNIYQLIDLKIEEALQEMDVHIIYDYGIQLRKIHDLSEKGLAYLISQLWHNWDEFDVEDDFVDTTFTELGVHRHTVERYRNWTILLDRFGDEHPELHNKAISTLVPAANAFYQGYEKEIEENIESFIEAPNHTEAAKIAREIKGDPGRSNRITLWIDNDTGELYAFSNGKRYFVASFELDSDEPVIQKAVERLLKNGGVLRS